MERALCPNCKVVNVPAGHVCFDCAYRTPQDRQNIYEAGETMLRSSLLTLRDRFAMSALPMVMRETDEDGREYTTVPEQHFTDLAYEWADLMLKSRLPESG